MTLVMHPRRLHQPRIDPYRLGFRLAHGLTPAQRRDNVRDAYVLTVPGKVLLGKRVLLVDDILTTGATLSECGRALKAGGAAFVAGLCAASPRKGSAV